MFLSNESNQNSDKESIPCRDAEWINDCGVQSWMSFKTNTWMVLLLKKNILTQETSQGITYNIFLWIYFIINDKFLDRASGAINFKKRFFFFPFFFVQKVFLKKKICEIFFGQKTFFFSFLICPNWTYSWFALRKITDKNSPFTPIFFFIKTMQFSSPWTRLSSPAASTFLSRNSKTFIEDPLPFVLIERHLFIKSDNE